MRWNRSALAVISLSWVVLSAFAGLAHGRSPGSGPSKDSGCVFVVVRDSVTGKPVGYANCIAPYSLHKGCIADSLGCCLICGLPGGAMVITTQAIWHSRLSDRVRVVVGRIDTLQILLGPLRVPPGDTVLYDVKYIRRGTTRGRER